ncbi:MAG TPA: S24 family peptidase [Rhodocyclaceae bacterium]
MDQNHDPKRHSAAGAAPAGQALRGIPVRAAPAQVSSCAGEEAFALQVLGSDMAPEFVDGDIIIVEPDGLVSDGSFVVARHDGEWLFRQIVRRDAGWVLVALADGVPEHALSGLDAVRGVIIEKTRPGRRRERKRYVD